MEVDRKPRHGIFYSKMCATRKVFKQVLKNWKFKKDCIFGRKLVNKLETGNHERFWSKLRRGTGSQSPGSDFSHRIGQAYRDTDILNL